MTRFRTSCNWVSIVLVVLWSFLALRFTVIGFDPIWYHLPFSSYLWNIGGGYTNFHMTFDASTYWLGFPKMGEFLQGFFWKITGSLHAVVIPHILLLGIYCAVLRKCLRVPSSLVIIGFFANPELVQEYIQSYIDLLSSLAIAASIWLFARFVFNVSRGTWDGGLLWGGAVLIAIGATSKHPALISAEVFLGLLAGAIIVLRFRRSWDKFRALVATALIAVTISAVSITDYLLFDNPFYPVRVAAAGHTLFAGTTHTYPAPAGYPYAVMTFSPVAFFLSASELDWSIRGVRVYYSVDSNTGDEPLAGQGSRTGGWGGLLFVFLFAALVLALFAYLRAGFTKRWKVSYFSLLLALCCPYALIETFIPGSHELRYFNVIYLVMMPLALKWLVMGRAANRSAFLAFFLIAGYYHASGIFSHTILLSAQNSITSPEHSQITGHPELAQLDFSLFPKDHIFFISAPTAFQYSQAYTGIPIRISSYPPDRDIFCPIGEKIESILLPQYLTYGWSRQWCVEGTPCCDMATIDLRTDPPPTSDLRLVLRFRDVLPGFHGNIAINKHPPNELKLDSENTYSATISTADLAVNSVIHIEMTQIPVQSKPFTLTGLELKSSP